MAYETKVILTLLAQQIGNAESVQEAYEYVVRAASVEGVQLPSFEEWKKEVEEIKSKARS